MNVERVETGVYGTKMEKPPKSRIGKREG